MFAYRQPVDYTLHWPGWQCYDLDLSEKHGGTAGCLLLIFSLWKPRLWSPGRLLVRSERQKVPVSAGEIYIFSDSFSRNNIVMWVDISRTETFLTKNI